MECGAEDLVAAEESRSVETRGWSFNITIFKEGEGSNCYDFVTRLELQHLSFSRGGGVHCYDFVTRFLELQHLRSPMDGGS